MPDSSDSHMGHSQDHDPTALAYCRRLAQQIIAFSLTVSPEDHDAFRNSFRAAFRRPPSAFRQRAREIVPAHFPVDELAEALYKDPPAQARFASIIQYPPGKWILERELTARGYWPANESDMESFKAEWTRLASEKGFDPPSDPPDVYEVAPLYPTTGLCFSGGGIRSATFNLGVLQGLAEYNRLKDFDYLSSVSGGGYIHQFLASWIHCENLEKVTKQLRPLPGPPSDRTFWPEPLRWLRRYSNYLTPKVGLFTADTWVAFAIWLRNTFLNQIIVISALLFVLLLPHLRFNHTGLFAYILLSNAHFVAIAVLVLFLLAAFTISTQIRGPRIQQPGPNGDCPPYDEDAGLSQYNVLARTLLPIMLAILLISPYLYRSAFWRGIPVGATTPSGVPAVTSSHVFLCELHTLAHPFAKGADPNPCLQEHPPIPYEPLLIRTEGLSDYRQWRNGFSFRWWSPLDRFKEDPPASYVFLALILGTASLIAAGWRAFSSWQKRLILALALPGTMTCAYLLIGLSRFLIFAASFFLPIEEVTRFNIAIVPLLGLTIVFVSIEIAGGLIGNSVDESVREWFARLRAWSFLTGIVWFAFFASSLLGPYVVSWIVYKSQAWRSVLFGWAGTTLVSVLLGKSSYTSGAPGDKDSSRLSKILNLITLIGPPVFILGLVLILSAVDEKALLAIENQTKDHILGYTLLALFFFAIAVLFGWRVDVNEFSLNAFYRDRLARCYAGASNPDRRPNRFTGFAASDKRLRLIDLLPQKFTRKEIFADLPASARPPQQNADSPCSPQPHAYEGPFPIFNTTVNLSFGQDLAYQERKGGGFAFTPLYCGYDVGWTDSDTPKVQFNGYTPTESFAFEGGGPSVAAAVATSGAAVSPNWGYHSSPTMAFLLTLFNFRLGLWIRNPRRKQGGPLGTSPGIGLFYLFTELFGLANDDSRFVYLTDGGHFENMGLYELVRRRCSTIVICDAEQDEGLKFEGIGMAIRKCRIDFGTEIVLDLSKLKPIGHDLASPVSCVAGTVHYPVGPGRQPFQGEVLYIKSTYTEKLAGDLLNYRLQHPSFPNDSTLNQWFTESQFESYRRLGIQYSTAREVIHWFDNLQ